jgi:single-strand DNA-binding protein
MNLLIITGNLGRDAEQRHTANGDSVVSFSVAVKSGYGDKAKTTWVKCTMWGKRGESVLPYLVKGQQVGVSGEFSMNEFENKEGQKISTPEVRVNEIDLLGKKSDSSNTHEQKPANSSKVPAGGGFDDMESDIPFN